jgi:hypothetical protein
MFHGTVLRWALLGVAMMIPAGILIPSSSVALAAHHAGAGDGYGATLVALIAVGGLFAFAGFAVEMIAYGKAIEEVRLVADSRWFRALLWAGILAILTIPLFGVGLLVGSSALTAYLVARPAEAAQAGAAIVLRSKYTMERWSSWGFGAAAVAGAVALLVPNALTHVGQPLHGHTWIGLALVSTAITAVACAAIVIGAAWWAALFNAYQLVDRVWFKRVLWAGVAAQLTMPLFGLGVLILGVLFVAYRRAAPDATTPRRPTTGTPTASPRLAL